MSTFTKRLLSTVLAMVMIFGNAAPAAASEVPDPEIYGDMMSDSTGSTNESNTNEGAQPEGEIADEGVSTFALTEKPADHDELLKDPMKASATADWSENETGNLNDRDGAPALAFDGKFQNAWHTKYDKKTMPHWIAWDLGESGQVFEVSGIHYEMKNHNASNGAWKRVTLKALRNGEEVASKEFSSEAFMTDSKLLFDAPVEGVDAMKVIINEAKENFACAGEITVYGKQTAGSKSPVPMDKAAMKSSVEVNSVRANCGPNDADGPAGNAFDGQTNTGWHSNYNTIPENHIFTIQWNLGKEAAVSRLLYETITPNQTNGRWKNIKVEVIRDRKSTVAYEGAVTITNGRALISLKETWGDKMKVTITDTDCLTGGTAQNFCAAGELTVFENPDAKWVPETRDNVDVNFYAFVNKEPVKVANRTNAYVIGDSYYFSAEDLAEIYAAYDVDPAIVTAGSKFFANTTRDGSLIYADRTAIVDHGMGYVPGLKTDHSTEMDIYYLPKSIVDDYVGKGDQTMLANNTFYTVTCGENSKVLVLNHTALGAKLPAAPEAPEGQVFDGWYNGETKVTETTEVTAAMTLTAKFVMDTEAVRAVEAKITEIGDVTLNSAAKITAAREAFNALTPAQKELVTNKNVLEAAETELARLQKVADDQAKAKAVEDKISAIGTVTLGKADQIAAAREAYNALTDEQKALVPNEPDLAAAEAELIRLQKEADDKAAAKVVEDQINAIGQVTLDKEADVTAAREAYEALAPEIQKHVSPEAVSTLEAAEAALADLKAVAQVGEKKYQTLQEAFNAAQENDTVTLLKNVDLQDGSVIIAADKVLTLELNGKTVSGTSNVQGHALITNRGNLTVQDTVGGGKISYIFNGAADTSYSKGNYTVMNRGVMTLKSGTVENLTDVSGHFYVAIDNNSSERDAALTITGGKVYTYRNYAIRQFANSTTVSNDLTVTGGEIVAKRAHNAVWVHSPNNNQNRSSTVVRGAARIYGLNQADEKTAAGIYFYVPYGENVTAYVQDSCLARPDAVASWVDFTGKTKYLAKNAQGVFEVVPSGEMVAMVVTGTSQNKNYTYYSHVGAAIRDMRTYQNSELPYDRVIYIYKDITETPDGVTLNQQDQGLILYGDGLNIDGLAGLPGEDGCQAYKLQNGMFQVTNQPAEAQVGGMKYQTLKQAINAAKPGETVVLLKDINITEDTKAAWNSVFKKLTVDFGGHTIYIDHPGNANYFAFVVGQGGDLTLKGEGGITRKSGGNYCVHVAHDTAKLTIEGGNYYGDTTAINLEKGDVYIKGGRFEVNPWQGSYEYTLNCKDGNYTAGLARFHVMGGTFVKFNPAASMGEPNGPVNFVAEGYAAVAENDNWTVVPAVSGVEIAQNIPASANAGQETEVSFTLTNKGNVPYVNTAMIRFQGTNENKVMTLTFQNVTASEHIIDGRFLGYNVDVNIPVGQSVTLTAKAVCAQFGEYKFKTVTSDANSSTETLVVKDSKIAITQHIPAQAEKGAETNVSFTLTNSGNKEFNGVAMIRFQGTNEDKALTLTFAEGFTATDKMDGQRFLGYDVPVTVPAGGEVTINATAKATVIREYKFKTLNGKETSSTSALNVVVPAADVNAAKAVDQKIDAIGTVTLNSEAAITEARAAYDALTEEQKALVEKLATLTAAEKKLQQLKTDKAAAAAVIAKIDAIGEVTYTPECKAKITAAKNAYNALTEEQQALVTNMDVYYAADNAYRDLEMAHGEEMSKVMPLIQRVIDLGEITLEDKAAIESIRADYNALIPEAQNYFQNFYNHNYLTDLEAAETKLAQLEKAAADQAAADEVIAKINAIGTVEYTPECKAKITAAKNAYNALTEEQQALVTNMDVYYAADNAYRDLEMAHGEEMSKVMPLIQRVIDLGEITLEDKAEIEAIRADYNALIPEAQNYFQNFYNHNYLTDLEAAETKLAQLEKATADRAAAQKVIDQINAIGEVTYTPESKAKITDAQKAYNALTADQKKLVTNLNVWEQANVKYHELEQAEKAELAKVRPLAQRLIDLGEITLEDEAEIQAIRAAYEALKPNAQEYFQNYYGHNYLTDLEAAEAKLADLKKVAIIGETKYDTLEAALKAVKSGETITLLKDTSGNGYSVPSGSNFTVDLNGHSYTIDGKLAGSTGYKSQGFQLLKDSTITFKNGTLNAGTEAVMLIQNYSNLTLEDVALNGGTQTTYVLSNNCGNIAITGNTSITAAEGQVAFDVCKSGSYTIPNVTVNTTGTITGEVEISGGNLNIQAGNFVGAIDHQSGSTQITGGTYTVDPTEYVVLGYKAVNNGNGTYTVQEATEVCVIKETNQFFEKVSDAVDAAQAGQTVVLLKNATDGRVLLINGVTLDLNGKNLTVTAMVAFKDNHVVDSAELEAKGQLNTQNIVLDKTNSQFPIYRGGSYVFGTMVMQQTNASFMEGSNGNAFEMILKPLFEDSKQDFLDGVDDNKFQIGVRLTWRHDDGTLAVQDFVYSNEFVAKTYSYNVNGKEKALKITVTGVAGLNELSVRSFVTSETTAECFGINGIQK